jgi:hypothetical protein
MAINEIARRFQKELYFNDIIDPSNHARLVFLVLVGRSQHPFRHRQLRIKNRPARSSQYCVVTA